MKIEKNLMIWAA